ncbi:MAG: glycosyltransferase family 2 protein [Lachnospiraceae bacterium]|nr:glycosyltransferase family 2 protein [Lachnospiraceae bacterium]
MKLIIQIPCYNEAKTLTIALDALPKHIDGIDEIEYLIINDGSKDETVQVARDWGIDYVVSFPQNKGLARGFMAGLDACIRNGADIIVNTDADNQYCGEDIEKLVRPILNGEAEIVIGERPIDDIDDFSPLKKKLQHLGSYVVRLASATDIPDAPSGFRAFSKDAAMHLNVVNQYTYTLETIVQAGRNRMAITSVPIRTNPELRKSRLFHSMGGYIKKSMLTIIRAFLMYRPLTFFSVCGLIPFTVGMVYVIRFLIFFAGGNGAGHTQSLVFATMLIIIGFMTFVLGLQADIIAANRKILEDVQYRVRRMEASYSSLHPDYKDVSAEKKGDEKSAGSDTAEKNMKEAD